MQFIYVSQSRFPRPPDPPFQRGLPLKPAGQSMRTRLKPPGSLEVSPGRKPSRQARVPQGGGTRTRRGVKKL